MKSVGQRSFAASKYPKGSQQRLILNSNPKTSEYYTSEKWYVEEDHYMSSGDVHPTQPKIYRTFKTRKLALDYFLKGE